VREDRGFDLVRRHDRGGNMDSNVKLKQIIGVLDQLAEDTSVPRNIRRGATDAKERLLLHSEALDVRTASAIIILDELANDPNIPLHGRTLIWNIISQLETVK
jgi:uncharacterized protein (UPF0147 family)